MLLRLKEIRTDNDIKQKDIADILNITRTTYSNWENGYGIMPLSKINSFCNYFKISLDYVCKISNIKNNPTLNFTSIDKKIVGNKLKEIRKLNKNTQEFVSQKLKMGQAQYSQYELGKYLITTPMIIEFAKYYNVSIDYLCNKTTDFNILK